MSVHGSHVVNLARGSPHYVQQTIGLSCTQRKGDRSVLAVSHVLSEDVSIEYFTSLYYDVSCITLSFGDTASQLGGCGCTYCLLDGPGSMSATLFKCFPFKTAAFFTFLNNANAKFVPSENSSNEKLCMPPRTCRASAQKQRSRKICCSCYGVRTHADLTVLLS